MPRKAKVLPPESAQPRKPRAADTQLHDGHLTRGLPMPNHLLSEDECSAEDQKRLGLSTSMRWPLTKLQHREDGTNVGVFVHPRHGADHWSEWADHPPTWMDPHLLADLARANTEMQALLARAFKKNDMKYYKAVEAQLQKVFEEEYLPLVINRFLQMAVEPLAQWLTNEHVGKELQKPKRRRRNTEKTAQS